MNTSRLIRSALLATFAVAATASFADAGAPYQGEAAYAPRGEYAGQSTSQPVVVQLSQTHAPTDFQAAVAYQPRGEYARQQAPAIAQPAPTQVAAGFAAPYQGDAAWKPRGKRNS